MTKLNIVAKEQTLYLSGNVSLSCLNQGCIHLINQLQTMPNIDTIDFSELKSNDSSLFALLVHVLRYKKSFHKNFKLNHLPNFLLSLIEVARLEEISILL